METLRFSYNQQKDTFQGPPSVGPNKGAIADLVLATDPLRGKTVEEIIYSEPDGNDIMDVFGGSKKLVPKKIGF